MNVALLVGEDWLDEFLPVYRHLVIGLIDESVPVVQVVPDVLPPRDTVSFGKVLYWHPSRWNWLSHRRLMSLAEPLQAIGVDLIHIASGRFWKSAVALAQAVEASVTFEVYDQTTLEAAEDVQRAVGDLGLSYVTGTEPMQHRLVESLGDDVTVALARPGIHTRVGTKVDEDTAVNCLAVALTESQANDDDGWLAALSRLVREYPQLMIFVDVPRGKPSQVFWKHSRKLDLFAHLTLATRPLGRFEMLTQADALLMPGPAGQVRGVALHAMLAGRPILAAPDRAVDYLRPGETCRLVENGSTDEWYAALKWLLENPRDARQLGKGGTQWAAGHYRVSSYVNAITEAYRQATGESIPFDPQSPSP